MFWVFIIVVMVLYRLDDLIEVFRMKDESYRQAKLKKEQEEIEDRNLVKKRIDENIGKECRLYFGSSIQSTLGKADLLAEIVDFDGEWLELSYIKYKKNRCIIVNLEQIVSVSMIV